ncbi:MAG TPA: inositol monophosphatase family protein [Actinomycetota bacterium]|nr:inositol monophosphatase family protein [Actinomycetota bacterium]
MEASALLEIAEGAAREAGALLMERFGSAATGVSSKSTPTDPVSDADRDAEALISRWIAQRRPLDGIVTEEGGGEAGSGLTWVVDPLDGTVNFLFGIPSWSVSIAVEDAKGAVAGVVFDPNRGEMFSATRGGGAHLNGKPIHVSARTDLAHALIGTGFAYDAQARAIQGKVVLDLLPKVRDIRRFGSAALDLAAVACGRLDGFFEAPTEWWDRAAGVLLVREAGGVVSELPPPLDLSPGVVAAGPELHPVLASLVAS